MTAPSASSTPAAPRSNRQVFFRSAGIVAASVLLSRVLGFFREWAIAHQVGSNAVTDAYYAAFTIPDILNYLLAGGSLSITFVPVFLEYFSSNREKEAWRVFSVVLTFLVATLIILLFFAEIFAGHITMWIAPGFNPSQKELVTHLTRIMLPAQAFFVLGGVLTAVQYARGQFVIPSLAPLIYNGMIIVFGGLFARRWGIESFSWGVLAGSFIGNFLIQVYGAARAQASFHFEFNLNHPGFRRFMRLSLPIMVGFSLIFADDWAIRFFGSFLIPASITWLSYGKTLMRVVVAVFAQAAGVASFPTMARLVAEKKLDEMKHGLQEALHHVILAMVPVSVLMALLSRQIVYLLFSHTRLTTSDIERTALALVVFLIGAIAWGVQAIIGRGFYALGDTLRPTLIGTALAILWLPIYWQLGKHFEYVGLATASTLGVIVYTAVLCVVLFRRLQMNMWSSTQFLAKTTVCSAAAALVSFLLQWKMNIWLDWRSMTGSFSQAAVSTASFVIIFLAIGSVSGIATLRDLRRVLLRKR